jgi:site-specific recombinase XerD
MPELTRWRLARASQNWFFDTELSSSADAYVRYLRERGYSPQTVTVYLESVAHFAHWSARQRIRLAEINEGVIGRFLERHLPVCRCARRCQRTRHGVRAALVHLLRLLRTEGWIAPRKSADPATVAKEINRFEHYLTEVCGLSPVTCRVRLQRVRAFLLDGFAAGRTQISAVKPTHVIRFMTKYTKGWATSSKRAAGDSLRSYFRFKALQGEHADVLCAAIPTVAQWRMAGLPKGISADQLNRLLKAFDRSSATGIRDYAITRCLVDLGLRAIEVARLRLEDIDWRQGLVHVRGKGHRVDVLPLPRVTGCAIANYLRRGRPPTNCRALFMRHRPPVDTPATACVVRAAVRYAAARCGLEHSFHGPHALRHSLAQRLVQGGTPLKQIADLLRHRSLDTTTIYAKVDLPALHQVALPWPGRQS